MRSMSVNLSTSICYYNYRTEDAKFHGCVTDLLPNKKYITIPKLSNLCTKHCYRLISKEKFHRCPYTGEEMSDVGEDLERQIFARPLFT